MRAQSNVVGVALLLGIAAVGMAALTAGAGVVLDQQAASADAALTADRLAGELDPTATGVQTAALRYGSGTLRTADRQVRVYRDGERVAAVDADALLFEQAGGPDAAFLAGAVRIGGKRFVREPAITLARTGDRRVLGVGVAALGGEAVRHGARAGGRLRVRLDVTHDRRHLGRGQSEAGKTVTVAVETTRPGLWERYFAAQNASVSVRDVDGDGVASVLARYRVARAYLVVHRMRLRPADAGGTDSGERADDDPAPSASQPSTAISMRSRSASRVRSGDARTSASGQNAASNPSASGVGSPLVLVRASS
jgi:hypothetical protein